MSDTQPKTEEADSALKSQYFDLLKYKNCKPKTVSDGEEREKLQEALEDKYQKELERNREHRFSKDAVRMKKMSKKLKKGSKEGKRDSKRKRRCSSPSEESDAAEELPFFMMDASIRAAMKEREKEREKEKKKEKKKRDRRHKEKKEHLRKRRHESSSSSDSESSDDSRSHKHRRKSRRSHS
eukprot:Selendium_serpulae@DN6079_c0_g1_i6.p2